MNYIETEISGLWIIEPDVLGDDRGIFFHSFRMAEITSHLGYFPVVQEYESHSKKGVIRGLHLQVGEYSQAKLARCVRGALLDVAVDLRFGSPTFGKHVATVLSAENKRQLFVPRGFAHGILALEEDTILQYKVDNPYHPQSEYCLRFDDPDLGINWASFGVRLSDFIVSQKDKNALSLQEFINKLGRE